MHYIILKALGVAHGGIPVIFPESIPHSEILNLLGGFSNWRSGGTVRLDYNGKACCSTRIPELGTSESPAFEDAEELNRILHPVVSSASPEPVPLSKPEEIPFLPDPLKIPQPGEIKRRSRTDDDDMA